jgi:hypothetical protein
MSRSSPSACSGSSSALLSGVDPVVAPSNQRMKLPARGGRLVRNGSVLSAAAAGRSLSAFR